MQDPNRLKAYWLAIIHIDLLPSSFYLTNLFFLLVSGFYLLPIAGL